MNIYQKCFYSRIKSRNTQSIIMYNSVSLAKSSLLNICNYTSLYCRRMDHGSKDYKEFLTTCFPLKVHIGDLVRNLFFRFISIFFSKLNTFSILFQYQYSKTCIPFPYIFLFLYFSNNDLTPFYVYNQEYFQNFYETNLL